MDVRQGCSGAQLGRGGGGRGVRPVGLARGNLHKGEGEVPRVKWVDPSRKKKDPLASFF